ncbi:uncharacterized protein [Periplaneta americana]|uniref:uncharacterized protein n=1 Tax=Periplaneta americana TaxID=6978 RepID=UPI0037E7CB08
MTRNLGTAHKGSISSQYKTLTREHLITCSDSSSNEDLSLRRFPFQNHSASLSVTSSLLCAAADSEPKKNRSRRDRVCKSWTSGYGYGTLVEGKESQFQQDRVVLLPEQQSVPSVLRSTVRRATSLIVATPWKPTADAAKPSRRRSRIDLPLMPSLKSLVSRRSSSTRAASGRDRTPLAPEMGGSSSSSVLAAGAGGKSSADVASAAAANSSVMVPLMKREGSCSSLAPSIRINGSDFRGSGIISDVPSGDRGASGGGGGGGGGSMRKCETVLALSSFGAAMLRSASSSRTTIHVEPLRPVNRLRVPPHYSSSGLSPNAAGGSTSRMCSRCSSLLSMASSSRYSLNTAGGGFVPCSPGGSQPASAEQVLLCKLCLGEVPFSKTTEIVHCGCAFCKDCMKSYIEFEIQEGAYDISCPDAQCEKQGVISLSEMEILVSVDLVEKHKKFRLNREVDLDVSRTWCPRAGCETVCNVCGPVERCLPQSVHCPTCSSDFCSNCKNPWHSGFSCEENTRRLAKEGRTDLMEPGIPFDSDLIKCCPMCNVPIEKDEGCAQMMCKRCKHVFCWYCLASLDDDFLLRHYDKGPCKNKLGHSRASVIWHRTQVIGIFAGFGILLLVASPLLLLAAPCIVCCKCRVCSGSSKLDTEDEIQEESAS